MWLYYSPDLWNVDRHCMYEWDLEQELLGLEAMLDLTKEWEVG